MKLTQQDKARLLGIDLRTLRKWRKEKPYLYKIIMLISKNTLDIRKII
ncbi:MAG: hypothetical protein U9O56_03485 [Campylobacterota bacterium]|nr:hypothetical protein [Campylobacterota bacterium]